MEEMDKEQKTITVQEIGEIIRRDFSRKYRRFASYYNKFGQESRAASPAFPPSRA